MPVSDADREHMRRLGQYKAEANADRLAAHLAQPLDERLRRSFALMRRCWSLANAERRVDDPTAFYDRARRLGLYRP